MGVIRLFVAVLLIGGWTMAAMSLHIVQTANGIQLVTKNRLSFVDTFVDTRHWSGKEEQAHAGLYQRLHQLEKTAILERSSDEPVAAANTHDESVRDAWHRLKAEAAKRRN